MLEVDSLLELHYHVLNLSVVFVGALMESCNDVLVLVSVALECIINHVPVLNDKSQGACKLRLSKLIVPLSECIAHDSNNHIKEMQKHDERSNCKYNVQNHSLGTIAILEEGSVCFSKTELPHVHNCAVEVLITKFSLLVGRKVVKVKLISCNNIIGRAEGQQIHYKDQHEVPDLKQNCLDNVDEWGNFVNET